MGCASSGPIGKNLVDGAKETAGDVAHMGESALHDLGEAAKGGMEHVKEAVESAVHTAEHGLGSVMGKIEGTIGHKKEEAENMTSEMKDAVDGLEAATEETAAKVADGIVEEVSEAETVLASEAEDTKHSLLEKTTTITETLTPAPVEDVKVEDMEDVTDDGMGSAVVVDDSKQVEELVAKVPTPAPTPPPGDKEEPPTLWELEADAILNRPIYPSMHVSDLEPDKEPSKEEVEPGTGPAETEEVEAEVEKENEENQEQEEDNEQEKEEEMEQNEDVETDSLDLDLIEREENMRKHLLQTDLRIEELIG